MVAKKYVTVEEKRLARSRVNAQNYAKNRDRISKRRKQQYADMVQQQQSANTTRRKSSAKDDREKTQKTGSKKTDLKKTGSKEQARRRYLATKDWERIQKTVSNAQRRRTLTTKEDREKRVVKGKNKSSSDDASVKRPKTIATHKPKCASQNLPAASTPKEMRRSDVSNPSKNKTSLAKIPSSPSKTNIPRTTIPPTPSKARIPPARSKPLSSKHAHNDPDEIDEIEYLMDDTGLLKPKAVQPRTVFQLAYDNVHHVFLDYKALVGPEWISGFFNRLHATYTKDGNTGLLDQSHERIQALLHLMEHRMAILELEATDDNESTRVEMGRNMYEEILGTSRTLQRFRTAAAVGPSEVLVYMRTGKLKW